MTEPREAHLGACMAAKQGYGEIQGMISALREQAEMKVGLIAQATGGTACPSEPGRNAFEFGASLLGEIDVLYNHVSGIVAEIDRYAGGF